MYICMCRYVYLHIQVKAIFYLHIFNCGLFDFVQNESHKTIQLYLNTKIQKRRNEKQFTHYKQIELNRIVSINKYIVCMYKI